jgi:hypothetical protein
MNLPLDFVLERLGSTRVVMAKNYDYPMASVLGSLGIEPNADALFEVPFDRAVDCLTALLWKDMAYGTEMMPKACAEAYAKELIDQFPREGARSFTNGEWDQYDQVSAFSYMPITKATFSAVVIVVHPKYAVCILVEDED